jgi:hypothetical protein
MKKSPADEIFAGIGAEPIDGSGFQEEEPESADEVAVANREVAR